MRVGIRGILILMPFSNAIIPKTSLIKVTEWFHALCRLLWFEGTTATQESRNIKMSRKHFLLECLPLKPQFLCASPARSDKCVCMSLGLCPDTACWQFHHNVLFSWRSLLLSTGFCPSARPHSLVRPRHIRGWQLGRNAAADSTNEWWGDQGNTPRPQLHLHNCPSPPPSSLHGEGEGGHLSWLLNETGGSLQVVDSHPTTVSVVLQKEKPQKITPNFLFCFNIQSKTPKITPKTPIFFIEKPPKRKP